jgi:hypothetical protein
VLLWQLAPGPWQHKRVIGEGRQRKSPQQSALIVQVEPPGRQLLHWPDWHCNIPAQVPPSQHGWLTLPQDTGGMPHVPD